MIPHRNLKKTFTIEDAKQKRRDFSMRIQETKKKKMLDIKRAPKEEFNHVIELKKQEIDLYKAMLFEPKDKNAATRAVAGSGNTSAWTQASRIFSSKAPLSSGCSFISRKTIFLCNRDLMGPDQPRGPRHKGLSDPRQEQHNRALHQSAGFRKHGSD